MGSQRVRHDCVTNTLDITALVCNVCVSFPIRGRKDREIAYKRESTL